jgi:Inner membrane protein YgaP-like, transmembrane domain
MKKNMGKVDRILRATVGIGALGAGLYFGSWWGLLGLIPLTISAGGFCPLFYPFGFKSCRTAEGESC